MQCSRAVACNHHCSRADSRAMKHRLHVPPSAIRQPRAEQERRACVRVHMNAALYRSAAWKTLRAHVLEDHPLCMAENCDRRAIIVDHIRPHGGDNELFFDERNLQALCKHCHDSKTHTVEGHGINQRTHGALTFKRTTED